MNLNYTLREDLGSRSAKRLRKQGMIPAVLYGKGNSPQHIVIEEKIFKIILKKLGRNGLVNLICDNNSYTAIIKELDCNLINNTINNISFQVTNATDRLQLSIPLVLTGEFYNHDGILEQQLSSILVECLATDIPRNITFDTSNLTVGDSINVKDIVIPEDIVILTSPNTLIGSIVKPKSNIDIEDTAGEVS